MRNTVEGLRERVVVDSTSGCWRVPDLKVRSDGYLRVSIAGTLGYLHRIFYEHYVGVVPEGFELDHTCHTDDETCRGVGCEHRGCVNPDHMDVVTRRENIERSHVGVVNRSKEECSRGHVYDDENTYHRPDGGRDCRVCMRERSRESYARRKAS